MTAFPAAQSHTRGEPGRPVVTRDAPLLSVRDLSIQFSGITALDGVSFDVAAGQIVGLIGPNGAGKTTIFNCLSRLCTPTSGDILFEGRSILAEPPRAVAALGIGRTFQNAALFDELSVLNNVKVGCHSQSQAGFMACAMGFAGARREDAAVEARARALIHDMQLEAYANSPARTLPFPIRKRVELARALASKPKLLLLDEPAAGLNLDEVETLKTQVRQIRDVQQVTVLLVEHHMGFVMSVSDTVLALNFGRRIAMGPPAEVRRHPEVVQAYLGTGSS